MKHLYSSNYTLQLLALMALLFTSKIGAQCPTGNVILTTQAEVNAFATNYPNCTTIAALQIGAGNTSTPSNITDLAPLAKITQVNGNVFIQNNGQLQNLNGLKISNITGRLYIGGDNINHTNTKLQNINALSTLTNVGGFLQILNHPILADINGLSNLKSVALDIEINGNTLLSNISGLQNTTFNPNGNYGLTITNNPALSACNLPKFCTYLANPSNTHPRIISGNLSNCLNEVSVKIACGILSVIDINKTEISVYPNPARSTLNFSEDVSNLLISDISGKTIIQILDSKKSIDVSKLKSGTYIITATTKTGNTITKKIIKQ